MYVFLFEKNGEFEPCKNKPVIYLIYAIEIVISFGVSSDDAVFLVMLFSLKVVVSQHILLFLLMVHY